MTYDELLVLIPSHSLEDFPSDLPDDRAAGLLNAFAVLWHPRLLATARTLPRWHRSDEPPDTLENRLVIVPSACSEWLPGGWVEHARAAGARVIDNLNDRGQILAAALEPLQAPPVDDELAADFLALGTCYLQLELLTRHMHHFSNLDEVHLQREALAGAEAAVANDREAACTHLKNCFEILLEARERFYPVDCYLLDLCLVIPRLADSHFARTIDRHPPVNVLASAADLEMISREHPELHAALKAAWQAGNVEVVGGELREGPSPLLPIGSVIWGFEEGHRTFRQIFGRGPATWGRRRYGLSTLLPQVLARFGYWAALHVVLDDGIYPDEEHSKIRWEGCDGSVIDAITRIPLAADSAASFLRFSKRMAESMENDHVAALQLARWPELTTPWLDDLKRIAAYAPVLGRFTTYSDYFRRTDDPGRLWTFRARDYLSPFFIQAVARQERDPISRFFQHTLRRHAFEAGAWYFGLLRTIQGRPPCEEPRRALESRIESLGPDAAADNEKAASGARELDDAVAQFAASSARELAGLIAGEPGSGGGLLVLNSLSFPRLVVAEIGSMPKPPQVGGNVKAVQFDDRRQVAVVEVPACGFAWIAPEAENAPPAPAARNIPLTEGVVLRSDNFEVYVNETTGGIARVKGYGRKPNRLSQQIVYRFPRERKVLVGEGDDAEEIRTPYSEMMCKSIEVTSSGPALGEIVTTGVIVDQANGETLAEFRQTTRVWRKRPYVEVEIELDPRVLPDADPWSNYYACRFAWNDSTASLTRSLQQGAHPVGSERFESPHYLEIASDEERVTILNCGLPFHRKTGARMVDTLLISPGETARTFRFAIAVDAAYPMEAALDVMVPAAVLPAPARPPRAGNAGWFFHLDARNVQILSLHNILEEPPPDEPESPAERAPTADRTANGFAVRLIETEGRHRKIRLRCFKTPRKARQRNFLGKTLTPLAVEGDAVIVNMTAYEIADVELLF